MLEPLLDRFRQGNRRALARLLSHAARGEGLEEIREALSSSARRSRVVAVTGSAGVGKSTLVGKLIGLIRSRGQSVAVLACDPQSPVSGGALLGDRFRMPANAEDEGVFIRSLATLSGRGAVADHLDLMLRLLETFGFEVILIETVGAGQGDTAIRDLADVVLLLLQPETGDDLQWEKAGLLEVADVVAIHKADLPQADRVEAQVRSMLGLNGAGPVAVLRVSAKTGEGIEALWDAIAAVPAHRPQEKAAELDLLRLAQEGLAAWFAGARCRDHAQLQQLLSRWEQGGMKRRDALAALFRLLEREYASAKQKV
jgi:LAO/AO transport system ATPase